MSDIKPTDRSDLKSRVMKEILTALEKEDFTRTSPATASFQIEDHFFCWAGVSSGFSNDALVLYPNVGLHVDSVEQLICEIDQGPYSSEYQPSTPTIAQPLGSVESIGDEPAFSFAIGVTQSVIGSECARLASLYSTKGLEFAREMASLERLAPFLRDNAPTLGGYPERYAATLYLMGKKEEAQAYLLDFPGKYQQYISGFAVPFLARIGSDQQNSH